jgi:glucuronate isomerase
MTGHADRWLPTDPATRELARTLYQTVCNAPLICAHGHADPSWFAQNHPFQDPAELLIASDPYVLRLLHGHGVPLEQVGVRRRDGAEAGKVSPHQAWRNFARHYRLFHGTPTRLWLDAVLADVFDLHAPLTEDSADAHFERIIERLADPAFRPRALFERFRIAFLATTDGATDDLAHHAAIRSSGWPGRIVPTFRPDTALDPDNPDFFEEIARLAALTGENTETLNGYLNALRARRQVFKAAGATATDHGHPSAATTDIDRGAFRQLFEAALRGALAPGGAEAFRAQMLTEMAQMSIEDGLVMQLHAGAWRGYNKHLIKRYGGAKGESVPQRVDFVGGLKPLLDRFGGEANFRLILFTLDESTYARELAPLAGVFPCIWLGAPWWFHDSAEGMMRFRCQATETCGYFKHAGFVDDTRAFFSIPARHDLARRMDAGFLATQVRSHMLSEETAFDLITAMTSALPKRAYRVS